MLKIFYGNMPDTIHQHIFQMYFRKNGLMMNMYAK